MKILFKNITKYDKENTENFIEFHQNKYGKKELVKKILIGICVLYLIFFNLIKFSWKSLWLLIVLGLGIFCISKYANDKKEEKKKKQNNKEFIFSFYERYIKIKYKRQFERMIYLEIKRIHETEKNFFLYIDDKRSLILDKDGFSIGTSKEFSEFIKRKCLFKYNNK